MSSDDDTRRRDEELRHYYDLQEQEARERRAKSSRDQQDYLDRAQADYDERKKKEEILRFHRELDERDRRRRKDSFRGAPLPRPGNENRRNPGNGGGFFPVLALLLGIVLLFVLPAILFSPGLLLVGLFAHVCNTTVEHPIVFSVIVSAALFGSIAAQTRDRDLKLTSQIYIIIAVLTFGIIIDARHSGGPLYASIAKRLRL